MSEFDTDGQEHSGRTDYTDGDVLQQLYWEDGLTIGEIADIFGVSVSTIHRHMKSNGVERESRSEAMKGVNRVEYAQFHTKKDGYERWRCSVNGSQKQVTVHQLLAVSCGADPNVVFSDEYVVHHKLNIPWLNVEWNLEVLSTEDHSSFHNSGESHGMSKLSQKDVEGVRRLLDLGVKQEDIAERYGVSRPTISDIHRGHSW